MRLLVAKSQVPGGGLGVFTEQALPAGTTLGAYPGRLLYMAEYSRKLAEHPRGSTSKTRPVWPGQCTPNGWPMLAEAWGSLRHDLALTAASEAPAGRSLRHLVFVVGTGAPARTAGSTPAPTLTLSLTRRASSYCWKRQDGSVLDPTDRQVVVVSS